MTPPTRARCNTVTVSACSFAALPPRVARFCPPLARKICSVGGEGLGHCHVSTLPIALAVLAQSAVVPSPAAGRSPRDRILHTLCLRSSSRAPGTPSPAGRRKQRNRCGITSFQRRCWITMESLGACPQVAAHGRAQIQAAERRMKNQCREVAGRPGAVVYCTIRTGVFLAAVPRSMSCDDNRETANRLRCRGR